MKTENLISWNQLKGASDGKKRRQGRRISYRIEDMERRDMIRTGRPIFAVYLLFYIVYAMSPLSAPLGGGSFYGCSCESIESISCPKILLLEFFFQGLTQDDDDQPREAPSRFLMKKIRAIIPRHVGPAADMREFHIDGIRPVSRPSIVSYSFASRESVRDRLLQSLHRSNSPPV